MEEVKVAVWGPQERHLDFSLNPNRSPGYEYSYSGVKVKQSKKLPKMLKQMFGNFTDKMKSAKKDPKTGFHNFSLKQI